MKTTSKGFTLIEVLIVLTIMSILVMVAYPAYQDQIKKSRRADAQSSLLSLSNALERYFTDNNTFDGAALGDGGIYPAETPTDSATKYYDLGLALSVDKLSYTISAVPKNGQAGDGCLQMASIGTRTHFTDTSDGCAGASNSW